MKVEPAQRDLYAALGRVASGLFIVTCRRDDMETGMLASWAQQCSFVPPLLTVCVAQGRYLADWLTDGHEFILNILDDTQTDMIAHFGKGFAIGESAFDGLEIHRVGESAAILNEALGYLRCRVLFQVAPGDHHLIVAEVTDGKMLGEGHPMVHVRKSGAHY